MKETVYTAKQWKADKTFQAKEGQEITKEIYNHFLNILPPIFISAYTYGSYTDIFLCSEPTSHAPDSKGIFRAKYNAFGKKGLKYYYLGERFPENIVKELKYKKS